MIEKLKEELQKLSNPKKAVFLQRFFKTGKGQYAEGDKFLGISVPNQRMIAKKFSSLTLPEIEKLLSSPIHEERLISLFILIDKFKKGNEKVQEEIFNFYLKSTKQINNWDLVDSSAHKIVGEYLFKTKNYELLKKLAESKNIWERRIAMIATYQFILNGTSKTTYEIANMLLNDRHDLIHKSVGWMLRESGKKVSESELQDFLKTRYKSMPRTMLRYAIERFPQELRLKYLKGEV